MHASGALRWSRRAPSVLASKCARVTHPAGPGVHPHCRRPGMHPHCRRQRCNGGQKPRRLEDSGHAAASGHAARLGQSASAPRARRRPASQCPRHSAHVTVPAASGRAAEDRGKLREASGRAAHLLRRSPALSRSSLSLSLSLSFSLSLSHTHLLRKSPALSRSTPEVGLMESICFGGAFSFSESICLGGRCSAPRNPRKSFARDVGWMESICERARLHAHAANSLDYTRARCERRDSVHETQISGRIPHQTDRGAPAYVGLPTKSSTPRRDINEISARYKRN